VDRNTPRLLFPPSNSPVVVSFDDDTVNVDGNHPLAGKDLTFELQLVEIA